MSITNSRASRSIEGIALIRSLNAISGTTVGCTNCESSRFWSGARLLCNLILPSQFRDGLNWPRNLQAFIGVRRSPQGAIGRSMEDEASAGELGNELGK